MFDGEEERLETEDVKIKCWKRLNDQSKQNCVRASEVEKKGRGMGAALWAPRWMGSLSLASRTRLCWELAW